MKTIILTFALVLTGLVSLWAQPDPNDLLITGYVLDEFGGAVDGQLVCAYHASGTNPSIADSTCAYTNANGWYYITVTNGSVIGANQTFDIIIHENCQNQPSIQTETVQNQQGMLDTTSVNFSLTCGSNSGCNCVVDLVQSVDPNGVYTFATTSNCNAVSYQWYMPDGTEQPYPSVSYQFLQDGAYGICVVTTDANGCAATACDTVYVNGNSGNGDSCVASFVYSVSPSDSGLVAFSADMSNNSNQCVWDFGDGNTGSGYSTSHSYSTNQSFYWACLTVYGPNGCQESYCDSVFVEQTAACDAYFYYGSTPNGAVIAGENTPFYYAGQNQTPSTFTWTMQGGGFITTVSDSMNPTLVFPNAGTYTVCLAVDNGQGCTDSYCANVYAVTSSGGGDSCVASFIYSVVTSDSGLVAFSADMSNNSNQYVWDFGDGNSGGGSTTSHSYGLNESWYWACLTVYGPNGCQDSYCDTISINGGNGGGCSAGFSNSGMTPIGYTFSAYNSDPSASYAWSIDNVGNQGSGASLYVPGFVDGAHTICLTVSAGNCTDTQCMTIYVSQDSCFGWLSGQVFAGNVNQPIDVAEVFLISFDANTNQLTEVQSTMIDSGGFYYFPMVPCGEYLVKAAATPNSAFYDSQLPTYYGNSTFWNYAQEIGVSEVMPAVQYDITLISGSNPGGPGFIGGDVTEGANKLADEGDPLEGIAVLLFDMGGNAIGYTYTDANGAFGFDNLAYGTYQVYTELINFTTVPAVVAIGQDNPMVEDIHIFVSDEFISTGVAEVNFDALVSGVYPSPMADNGSLTVNFEQNYTVTMSIVDLTGRVITSASRVLPAGKSTMAVAAAGLSEGYYILTMTEQGGAFSITRKFAVAH